MPGELTFANFRVGVDDVGEIGITEDHPTSVQDEVYTAFGVPATASPKEATGIVAPHAALQDNIAHGIEVLSSEEAQERYADSEDDSPFGIAHGWVKRSGLMVPVFRPFLRPLLQGESLPKRFDAACEPDRVHRWVGRMGDLVVRTVKDGIAVDQVIGISSGRNVGKGESEEFPAGTSSNEMMASEILGRVSKAHDADGRRLVGVVQLFHTPSKRGADVMDTMAKRLAEQVDLSTARVLVPAVAGNWIQSGEQTRAALQRVAPDFDTDPERPQMYVRSDEFGLGKTGKEPKETHQNSISGVGIMMRGFASFEAQA